MASVRCTQCHQPYPASGLPFRCPDCGGVYDFNQPPDYDLNALQTDQPGMWRYAHAFDLFEDAPVISLGEGTTPLVWEDHLGAKIGLKLESLNPSGSYKDRGSAIIVSQLLGRKATRAVEDSSGNAGASFAAYAARGRLAAKVFVPEAASGPKRNQIEAYGAELVRVPGPRSAAAQAVLQETQLGAVYASHAYLPFGLPGIATIAYEIWESLGGAPGTLIAPVGHGGLLLGIMRGFAALAQKKLIDESPYYVGVQAAACAPAVAAYNEGLPAMQAVNEGATLAEGVRVRHPVRIGALIREIPKERGQFIAIEENQISPACQDLAKRGFHVEPTSALVWSALAGVMQHVPQPVVCILTGSGLKYQPSTG